MAVECFGEVAVDLARVVAVAQRPGNNDETATMLLSSGAGGEVVLHISDKAADQLLERIRSNGQPAGRE